MPNSRSPLQTFHLGNFFFVAKSVMIRTALLTRTYRSLPWLTESPKSEVKFVIRASNNPLPEGWIKPQVDFWCARYVFPLSPEKRNIRIPTNLQKKIRCGSNCSASSNCSRMVKQLWGLFRSTGALLSGNIEAKSCNDWTLHRSKATLHTKKIKMFNEEKDTWEICIQFTPFFRPVGRALTQNDSVPWSNSLNIQAYDENFHSYTGCLKKLCTLFERW